MRTVVDEDTEKALDTVTAEKRNLQSLLRTKHRTYEEQVSVVMCKKRFRKVFTFFEV